MANSAPPKQRTTLELQFMVLREKAFKGDRRAIKSLQAFDAEYNRNAEPPPKGVGFLVVPESLTNEEWVAMYSPKELPPAVDEFESVVRGRTKIAAEVKVRRQPLEVRRIRQ